MKQKKKSGNYLNQQGLAMIVVMVTMLCVTALCLALLLASSVMLMNAERANQKEQCRITAISVSDVLEEKIRELNYREIPGSQTDAEQSLEKKLLTVATSQWYAYDKEASVLEQLQTKGRDYFTYQMDSGLPGETVLELYWIDEGGDLKNISPEDFKLEKGAEAFQNLVLYVKVTNTTGRESSTIISAFVPVVQGTWDSWSWNYIGREWERSDS